MSKYTELKAKHQAEVDAFPFGFAFNDNQFNEMMTSWGLTPNDTDKIYKIGGGGYIRKTDSVPMSDMFARHDSELKSAMQDEQFAFEAFSYELANHEYCITYDLTDSLDALDLTIEEINANPIMADALKRAIAAQGDYS